MIKQLLVGLGESEYARSAVEYACDLAEMHNAKVIGLSVANIPAIEETYHTPRPLGAGSADAELYKKSLEDARAKSEQALSEFEKVCQARGVSYEGRKQEGRPTELILKAASTSDLVILGRKSRFTCWLPEDRFDDVCSEVIEHSLRPMILVPKEHRQIKKLMIALDFQRLSDRLYFNFIHLNPYPQAEVHLVHANVGGKDKEFPPEIVDYFTMHGFKVKSAVLVGEHAGQALVNYAQTNDVDMVVMGVHSMSKILKALLGSTGRYVLNHLELPVYTQS